MLCFVLSLIATSTSQVTLGIGSLNKVASVLLAPLLARDSACSLPKEPLCAGIHLIRTWLFSSSLLSASTASRVVLDFI